MKSICLMLVVLGIVFALFFLNIHPFATAGGMGGGGGIGGGGMMGGGGMGGRGGGTGGGMGGGMGGTGGGMGGTGSGTQGRIQSGSTIPKGNYKADPISLYSGGGLDLTAMQLLLDADKDGYITREEWDRAFVDHDTNGDNRISVEELQAFFYRDESKELKDARQDAFERLNKNHSGVIERTEWPGNDMSFQHLDANHDGVISREEFFATGARWWNDTFENLDFDGNGVITRSEWLDSPATFDRLDRNHNGVIEKREFYDPH